VGVKDLFNGEAQRAIAAMPIPMFEPSPFDRAVANAIGWMQHENPCPSDALLPDGCSHWEARIDVKKSNGAVHMSLTWEARK